MTITHSVLILHRRDSGLRVPIKIIIIARCPPINGPPSPMHGGFL